MGLFLNFPWFLLDIDFPIISRIKDCDTMTLVVFRIKITLKFVMFYNIY